MKVQQGKTACPEGKSIFLVLGLGRELIPKSK
jgi:hypothetical protein